MSNKLKIEYMPVKTLLPYAKNSRTHSDEEVDELVASIKEFGWTNPVLIDEFGGLIAGHRRVRAAKKLKMKEVPCIVLANLSDSQRRAYVIADNRIPLNAGWDADLLAAEIKALKDVDYDISVIGFGDDDLDSYLNADEEKSETEQAEDDEKSEEIPEEVETRCKPGDLWALGKHRLLCGDSTKRDEVERLMGGAKADVVFTDPPYGMNLDTDYSKLPSTKASGNKKYARVIGDDKEFDPGLILSVFAYCKDIVLFGADYYAKSLPLGSWFVWDKRVTENFDAMIGSAFELAWSKRKRKREIARFNNTLFSGDSEARNKVHPTQKPVKMVEWFFERIPGQIVADLFLGSGSTLIACEKTGRRCFGMEIDPKYCDVILTRWEQFTGKTAERIDGDFDSALGF